MADWGISSSKAIEVLTEQGGYIDLGYCSLVDQNPAQGVLISQVAGGVYVPNMSDITWWYNNDYYELIDEETLETLHEGTYYPIAKVGNVIVGVHLYITRKQSGALVGGALIGAFKGSSGDFAEAGPFIYKDDPVESHYISFYQLTDVSSQYYGIYLGRPYYNNVLPYIPLPLIQVQASDSIQYTIERPGIQRIVQDGTTVITESDLQIKETTSTTGGGGGSLSIHSDPIGIPTLPNISALSTGLLSLYKPTIAQLQALGGYLWSDDILDELGKMWADPLDLIISLAIIPYSVSSSGSQTVKLGALSTGVSMAKLSSQYIQIDCGTINLKEYYASALDYSPFTSCSIFLPYVSVVSLNVDDVMDATLQVVYNIDLLSGDFVCVLKVSRPNLDSVLYHYSGNCLSFIPVTSQNTNKLIQATKSIGSFVGAFGGGASALASATVGSAMNTLGSKVTTSRSGGTSGNSGILDNMKPYLIIERPIQSLAQSYNHYVGYPTNITYQLLSLKGYTEIESVVANTLTCSEAEQIEIINLLKEGVYL